MSTRVWVRRAYDVPTRNDGRRVLVDRLWPRGLRRADAKIDDWLSDLAPSTNLRKWFGHDPRYFDEFERRYREELAANPEGVEQIAQWAEEGRVTLLYGARDTEHNNALVLREVVDEHLRTAAQG